MVNLTDLSDRELIQFVDEHFDLFASECDEGFPNGVLHGVERGVCAILRRAEGFAIAYKGRPGQPGRREYPADLLFLHVLPEHEKKGIGTALVEEIKASVNPGLPIVFSCEGTERRDFFARLGFVVNEHWEDEDVYAIRWDPATSHAA